jgi:hypothetical protein
MKGDNLSSDERVLGRPSCPPTHSVWSYTFEDKAGMKEEELKTSTSK